MFCFRNNSFNIHIKSVIKNKEIYYLYVRNCFGNVKQDKNYEEELTVQFAAKTRFPNRNKDITAATSVFRIQLDVRGGLINYKRPKVGFNLKQSSQFSCKTLNFI